MEVRETYGNSLSAGDPGDLDRELGSPLPAPNKE